MATRGHANSANANSTVTNANTYQGMVYGNHFFAHDTFMTGMAALGWDANDETRYNIGGVPGTEASGAYDSWQAATRWEAGRNFKNLPNGLTLTPSVLADYLHWQR